jgi:hypothetical protein
MRGNGYLFSIVAALSGRSQHTSANYHLSFSQKERGFPNEKNLGGYTPYQAILAIELSTRPALWVAFGKAF